LRRIRRRLAIAVIVLALPCVYLLRVALFHPLALTGDAPRDGWTRVAGVVHVHTTLSDGGGTPEEVIAAAHAAGLGFVAITDHNNLDAKPLEGFHQGVLVLVGAELSTPAGHVLGLGLDRDPVYRFNGDGLDALEDIRDLGGVAFAAHPFSARPDLRFSGWQLPGPWGLELLNGDSEWRRAGPRLLLTIGLYGLNPSYALLSGLGAPDQALRRWDALLERRDVVGIAGADAHSRVPLTKRHLIRFPSYEALFRLARIHLLLDRPFTRDAVVDRDLVTDALRRGRLYIGLDALASADQFAFSIEGPSGARAVMGETLAAAPGLRAQVGGRMPPGTRVLLRRDGRRLAEGRDALDVPLPGPGVYRVEARVPGWSIPWVISNPIYVFGAAAQAERRAAAAWPAPIVPRAVVPFTSLPGSSVFAAEHDPGSWMDPVTSEGTGGPRGGPVLKLGFRLNPPSAAQPFTWCALVNRQARDLGRHTGLHFWIRGDGEYRPWVQVRDVNPASADEGLEWWLASVRSSPEWREVFLPFARFRTINRKSDGRLDPAETRAIVFVLDVAAVKPGTRGTIWLADPGVYD
jgi:hypothetical protein